MEDRKEQKNRKKPAPMKGWSPDMKNNARRPHTKHPPKTTVDAKTVKTLIGKNVKIIMNDNSIITAKLAEFEEHGKGYDIVLNDARRVYQDRRNPKMQLFNLVESDRMKIRGYDMQEISESFWAIC